MRTNHETVPEPDEPEPHDTGSEHGDSALPEPAHPINWNLLTADEAEAEWLELNAWVNWLRHTYGLPAALIPRLAVRDDLPHEVQAAAFRVVQEALTNIRRHAADAAHIEVHLRNEADRLVVSVVDDGLGGTHLPAAARGGGFGLVGLKERVTALGGELDAGPRGSVGWQVRAVFPAGKS